MITKEWLRHNIKEFLILLVATTLTALSVEVFLIPADVVVGGAIGIASALDILLSTNTLFLSSGVWVFVLNIPIIIYCFLRYRRRFAVKTFLYVLILSLELLVLRAFDVSTIMGKLLNRADGVTDKVMYTLVGAGLQGLALPLMLSINSSTGGSDIVGMILQQRTKRSSSESMRAIFIANMIVIAITAVVANFVRSTQLAVDMVVYSIVGLFVCEIVQEFIFKGFSSAVELEITTDKAEEMAERLRSELKRGTTLLKVEGGYSHMEKRMVLCVVHKRQLTRARRIINEVDPMAFAYVENVKEVIGKGFRNKELELQNDED